MQNCQKSSFFIEFNKNHKSKTKIKQINQTRLTKFVFYEIELEFKNVITFIETGITEFNLLLIYFFTLTLNIVSLQHTMTSRVSQI